jgi:hypothetical protein
MFGDANRERSPEYRCSRQLGGYNSTHRPPTKPSIGRNDALYAIFRLSRIQ